VKEVDAVLVGQLHDGWEKVLSFLERRSGFRIKTENGFRLEFFGGEVQFFLGADYFYLPIIFHNGARVYFLLAHPACKAESLFTYVHMSQIC